MLTRELLEDIESGRVKHYRDIRGEEPPKEEELDEEMTLYEPSPTASEPLNNDIFRELGLADPDDMEADGAGPSAEPPPLPPPADLQEAESTRPPSEASARVSAPEKTEMAGTSEGRACEWMRVQMGLFCLDPSERQGSPLPCRIQ